jgi:hypothetical protein
VSDALGATTGVTVTLDFAGVRGVCFLTCLAVEGAGFLTARRISVRDVPGLWRTPSIEPRRTGCSGVLESTVFFFATTYMLMFTLIVAPLEVYCKWRHTTRQSMDFLDPKKQRQNTIVLYAGYLLIGIAIIISTIILLYQANGYEVDTKGKLVQNGLVFFSSQPNPATIYLNDKKQSQQTNSRVSIPAGQYSVRLARAGYHDWQHTLSVQGGDVQHFDYPFLVPKTLAPKAYGTAYASAPALVSQSRDKRWLMVQPNSAEASFDIYDLKNPTDPAVNVTIPAEIVATSNGAATWKVVAWADDNQHVLLSRNDASGTAYIMLNRAEVAQSKNLTTLFNLSSGSVLTLNNNKFDQYYLHVPATGELSAVSLSTPTPAVVIKNVQAFKTYDNSTVLYATTTVAPGVGDHGAQKSRHESRCD